MSVKNFNLVAAAAMALGLTVAADASPICENLLNDVQVDSFGAAEVDKTGRVIVIVEIVGAGNMHTLRPVCDSRGDVRLFPSADAAIALSKRSNLGGASVVSLVRFPIERVVGDPVAALKSKHRAMKAESLSADGSVTLAQAKISAAASLGWDVAVGTPEAAEYADLLKRQASIAEWKAFVAARVVALAAALTAAGINPDTYAPI